MIADILCRLLTITMSVMGVLVATWSIHITAFPVGYDVADRFPPECAVPSGERDRSSMSGCNDPPMPLSPERTTWSLLSVRHDRLTAILHDHYRPCITERRSHSSPAPVPGFGGVSFWCHMRDSSQYLAHGALLLGATVPVRHGPASPSAFGLWLMRFATGSS